MLLMRAFGPGRKCSIYPEDGLKPERIRTVCFMEKMYLSDQGAAMAVDVSASDSGSKPKFTASSISEFKATLFSPA